MLVCAYALHGGLLIRLSGLLNELSALLVLLVPWCVLETGPQTPMQCSSLYAVNSMARFLFCSTLTFAAMKATHRWSVLCKGKSC